MRYEINPDNFAVSIFNDGIEIPFQYQPTYPNGDLFDSVAEATVWAETSIASHNPLVETYAPNGKGWEAELKQQYQPEFLAKEAAKESAVTKLAALGLTADEIASLTK